jgi:hypothetical protein
VFDPEPTTSAMLALKLVLGVTELVNEFPLMMAWPCANVLMSMASELNNRQACPRNRITPPLLASGTKQFHFPNKQLKPCHLLKRNFPENWSRENKGFFISRNQRVRVQNSSAEA